MRLRRPPGVAVVAEVSTTAVQLRLDAFTIAATTGDVTWESTPGARDQDHYLLRISGGVVRVSLEGDASISAERPRTGAPAVAQAGVTAALNLVLDGVVSRAVGPDR